MENIFSPKQLRQEYFTKFFPYNEELAGIVDIKQTAANKKKETNHNFLKNTVSQNMHIYLVEYLLAFSRAWFNRNDFSVLDWGCGKCQVSYLLKKKGVAVASCDIETTEHTDSVFGQYTPNDKASLVEINRILKTNGLFFCFWLPYKYSWRTKILYMKGNYYHDHVSG
jgi:hypothetical protein